MRAFKIPHSKSHPSVEIAPTVGAGSLEIDLDQFVDFVFVHEHIISPSMIVVKEKTQSLPLFGGSDQFRSLFEFDDSAIACAIKAECAIIVIAQHQFVAFAAIAAVIDFDFGVSVENRICSFDDDDVVFVHDQIIS